MAFDEQLAELIRKTLGKKKGLVEKKEEVWRDRLPAERQHVRGGP